MSALFLLVDLMVPNIGALIPIVTVVLLLIVPTFILSLVRPIMQFIIGLYWGIKYL
jgi:hypothetical protein